MDEAEVSAVAEFRNRHIFGIFIVGAILIATMVVIVAMSIYYSSGAAQLDLSRPGYVSVRSQSNDNDSDLRVFPKNGKLSVPIIEDFKSSYNKHAQKVKAVDAFSGDPLSSAALGLNDPAVN